MRLLSRRHSVRSGNARTNYRSEVTLHEASTRTFYKTLFAGLVACILPASLLLALGKATFAGWYFWGAFAVLFLRHGLIGNTTDLLALIVAVSPTANILRSFSPAYILPTLLLLAALILQGFRAKSHEAIWGILTRYPFATGVFVFSLLYYAFSLIFTGEYEINLRFFEFFFAIVIMLILAQDRVRLGGALLGMGLCAWAVGLSMLPYVTSTAAERLGVIVAEGRYLGNPVTLGVPLAIFIIALLVDQGRWVGLEKKLIVRFGLLLPTVVLLSLTNSRGSWLVVVSAILLSLLLGRRSRIAVVASIGLAAIVVLLMLLTPYGEILRTGFDRTFGEERSVDRRTTGRADQWVLGYYLLTVSPDRTLFGYGPGLGPDIYARYSRELQGVTFAVGERMAWHSLYLQVAVETGLLGLAPLLVWLALALVRIFSWTLRAGAILPLACFVGYIMITLTVSGQDTNAGVLMGIGLFGTVRPLVGRKAFARRSPLAVGRRRAIAPEQAQS
jgi:O-antigen ligase